MPQTGPNSPTAHDIRAEILVELAALYRDPLSRSQFKRFEFGAAKRKLGEGVLRELTQHLIIEARLPNVVRLTELGYRLIEPELDELRKRHRPEPHTAPARGFGVAPPDSLVEDISRAVGGADFVMTTRLMEGRFVIDWATAGFEQVTGYTVQEIEAAGGWPAVLVDMPSEHMRERLGEIVGGRKLTAEIRVRTKSGRVIGLRHESWPLVDPGGTRVVGSVTGCRRVPRTG